MKAKESSQAPPDPRREAAALWWVDHARALSELATAIATGDRGRRMASRESLWTTTTRWGEIVGHPLAAALMSDHVACIAAFGDACARRDVRSMQVFLDQAAANVGEQARLYSADSLHFPENRWRDAFLKHTVRTAAYFKALMDGDKPGFEKSFRDALVARDEIASLWIEALGG